VSAPSLIGITGGVGCGKSEVGRILSTLGLAVLDTDELAHQLLQPGTEVAKEVGKHFGPSVVKADGGIDRKRLGDLVFADPEARRALERLVHPALLRTLDEWKDLQRRRGPAAALVPLLFEVGCTSGWDEIWCVSTEPAIVSERMKSRGWSEAQWQTRQAAQWTLHEKEKRATRVIKNNGSRDELAAAVQQAWSEHLKWRT
jgi:dephospho-CoA kinase